MSGILMGSDRAPVPPPVHGQRIEDVAVSGESRVVGGPTVGLPSPEVIEQAREAAYQTGFADGRAAALERSQELHRSLLGSLDQIRTQLDLDRRGLLEGVADLALEMATAVLGRTPHDDGAVLAQRIRELCSSTAQTTTRVVVSAVDLELVESAISSMDIAVEASPELGPGEARVLGDWSSAVITVDSMATTLRQAIGDAIAERPTSEVAS